jgi:hypothetical protein
LVVSRIGSITLVFNPSSDVRVLVWHVSCFDLSLPCFGQKGYLLWFSIRWANRFKSGEMMKRAIAWEDTESTPLLGQANETSIIRRPKWGL